MEMLIRRRNTLFQCLIATSRQRCINVRTTINDVDKRLFKRRNATLERRRISTLYQHFHCDYIATSVIDVIYGYINVVILRRLDVILLSEFTLNQRLEPKLFGRLLRVARRCSILSNPSTRYNCFALEKRVKSTYG